jgi:ferric-dicitrate binding protein FerR (iron transport regulator)
MTDNNDNSFTKMNQIPVHIESILTALFSGVATDSEVKTLREWLAASDGHRQLLNEYRQTEFTVKAYSAQNKYDADAAWKKLAFAVQKEPPRPAYRRIKHLYRYAAIIILAFGAGMAAMYYARPEPDGAGTDADEAAVFFTEYTVPYGSKSMIVLPDSSSIWMNAGSKLRYSSAFNQTEREVYIEGEAYFKVARNEDKPFFVKTSAVTLKVLGTSFNVKAYPEENSVETTVETGSVQMLRNVEGVLMDKLVLTAGQKATVIRGGQIDREMPQPLPAPVYSAKSVKPTEVAEKTIVTKNVSTELYTSWKDTRWVIEKETLASLAVKLERRFNVQITFKDESLKNFSFSGTLKDETLEQVLEAVKLSAPVNYTVRQNSVNLTMNRWIATD